MRQAIRTREIREERLTKIGYERQKVKREIGRKGSQLNERTRKGHNRKQRGERKNK